MPIQPNAVILPRAGHGLPVYIDPETHAPVAGGHPLKYLLALHVPQHDVPVLARRGDEGLALQNTEAAANGELFVSMALIGLLDRASHVVPQANAVVEVEGQYEATVW